MENIIQYLNENNVNFEMLNDNVGYRSILFEKDGEYVVDEFGKELVLSVPNFTTQTGSEEFILRLIKVII